VKHLARKKRCAARPVVNFANILIAPFGPLIYAVPISGFQPFYVQSTYLEFKKVGGTLT